MNVRHREMARVLDVLTIGFLAGVVGLVAHIMPLVALFQVFDGLSAITGGVLRARGKQVSLDDTVPARRGTQLCDSLPVL